jgi:hypothetical protein
MQVFGSPMGVRARRELLQKTPETKLALSGTFYLPRVPLEPTYVQADAGDIAMVVPVRLPDMQDRDA